MRGDPVAMTRRDRDHGPGLQPDSFKIALNFSSERMVTAGVVIDTIHLVNHDSNLAQAEEMQQIAVPARLLAYAFAGIDDQDGRVCLPAPVIMLRRNSVCPGAS